MTNLQELIERVERASGPDRELDGKIALSLGWTFEKMKGDARPYYRKPGVTRYYERSEPPAYTAALDAAMTLVPRYLVNELTLVGGSYWQATVGDEQADAATPALALCAASLKARLHTEGEG